ncbi:MAG: hypothetical protein ACK58L_16890 [Planctomycetota bacterium]
MKLSWHFSKVNPRFKNREATQGEFFASDTELRAFIREAIQNSLDARRPGFRGPVSIRLYLSGRKGALQSDAVRRYFKGGWDHFHAEGSGLRDAPQRDDSCPFIAYEDSGTTGLTGDVEQYHEVEGVRNPFYYFFRAEGQSNKLETGRGRWGLGKFVFPRSSRLRSFFGLTVRHDDRRRLLVGQSILRSHHVDGKSYTPDGWFGEKPEKDEPAAPVEDADFIREFERDFGLERGRDSGLSIVVPYYDEAWTAAAVVESVVQDYFYVILREELVVTVEDPDGTTILNAQSLRGVVADLEETLKGLIEPLLDLTTWSMGEATQFSLIPLQFSAKAGSAKSGSKWTRSNFDPELFALLRLHFHEKQQLAVRIPVEVQRRGHPQKDSWFDVYLMRAEGAKTKKPFFIRDGIIITDVRSRILRDVYAIVVIDDPPLTEFLGDAENPAHTEWHEESSHFKGKYVHGAPTLRFIRNAVCDMCQMLTEAVEEDDPELLLDVFSVGTSTGDRRNWPVEFASASSNDGGETTRLRSLKEKSRKPRSYRLSRREGGFRISGQSEQPSRGIEVLVAYDRRGGNPLRKFSTTDFQLGHAPIEIVSHGARIEITSPNSLVVYPEADQFDVIVTGFDRNRDLFLQARPGREFARLGSARDEMAFE